MQRFLLISLGALAFAGLLLFSAALFLFQTEPGRNIIIGEAEKRIGEAFASDVTIGALDGAPPDRLVLSSVTLSDSEGPWLTVERIELNWRPLKLIGGKVDVQKLHVIGAHLLRTPPPAKEESEDNDAPLTLSLPDNLPNIAIADIGVIGFRSDVSGVAAQLDGGGAIDIGGGRINANLNLTSENGLDNADIRIDLDPDENRLFVDMFIAALPEGAAAAFAGLTAPLVIEVKSDGALDNALISLNGELGRYGGVDASLKGDLSALKAISTRGRFNPGARFDNIPELAQTLSFDARLEERRRGGALILDRLTSAAGELSGAFTWTNSRDRVDALTAEFNAALAPSYRPDIQTYAGPAIEGRLSMKSRDEMFSVDAAISGKDWTAQLASGLSDLNRRLSGDLSVAFSAYETVEVLKDGALLGQLDLDLDDRARLQNFTLTLDDGSSVAGLAEYAFAEERLLFDGDLEASPALLTKLAPNLTSSDAVDAAVHIEGAADLFTLTAEIDAPALSINGRETPPLNATIALAGLPRQPTGDIAARAQQGEGRFTASLRSTKTGAVNVNKLLYKDAHFELKGSGGVDASFDRFTLDLVYDGDETAEPWPGLQLAGALALQGVFSRGDSNTDFTLSSPKLRLNDYAANDLTLKAAGPPRAIAATLAADAITTPQIGAISNLSATALLDLERGPAVDLKTLSGVATDNEFALLEPGSLSFADGVALDRLLLRWGRDGRIALDGAFTQSRWRADLDVKDANVPGADGRINLTLDLDTNNAVPARGAFSLSSLLSQNQTASISGDLSWDGREITLVNNRDADALDMRLILPARLQRTPALAIDMEGELSGYARYDGDVEVIAAYLPPTLQTLEGALRASFSVGGALSAPEISGRADIADGAYTELHSGFSLDGLHTEAVASYDHTGTKIALTGGARGADQNNGDTITLQGEVFLGETSNLDVTINLKDAALSAASINSLRADGTVTIKGPFDAAAANGDITISELNAEIVTPENTGLEPITVVSLDDHENGAETGLNNPTTSVDYDIKVSADDRIFVRGRGLESEWSASINAVNNRGTPLLLGKMSLRRGWLDFSGRRFALSRGSIEFDRLSPNDPLLDIRAEYQTGDGVTAIITISGRARAPSVELSSTPSRPSEDVMALVLFGKPAENLSAVESLQTAQALASLGGVGPFGGEGLTGTLRRAAGLDLLNFDVDPENGGGSLTVGKYVTDGLFVSATQNASGKNGSVRVEYDVTDNISVETEIEQDGDQTVSANWKKDF